MAVSQKPASASKSMPAGLALGWIAEVLLTTGACLILAMLILESRAGWGTVGYAVPVILTLSAYLGATVSGRLVGKRIAVVCALSGALYLGTLLAIAVLLFGGAISAFWIPAVLIAGGTGAAALLCSAPKKRKKERRRRRRM